MRNKTSLQDIADALGITKVTVSRALKGQAGVSEDLRKSIVSRAEAMGYTIDSLRPTESRIHFAFVTPARFFLHTDLFYTNIYYYLDKLCSSRNYDLSLHILDPETERTGELPPSLVDKKKAGIFIGGELQRSFLERIDSLNIPTIVIDFFHTIPAFGYVTVDNFYLGYTAARYLIEKGHRSIGFVGRKNISSNVTDRLLGVQKALDENSIEMHDEWILENHDPKSGLYTLDFALPASLPTAFICHCDRAAYFLVEKLKSTGLAVPEDVSVLSFDDTEIARDNCPRLTAIRIDRNEFASRALILMEEYLDCANSRRKRIYLETEIIERDSVKNIAKT